MNAPDRAVPVLLYHHVGISPNDPYAVSPVNFAEQLDLLAATDHTFLTVSEFAAVLRDGRPLPHPAAVLTFDDGYHDTLDVVGPLLRERALPATVYVTTGYLPGCPEPALLPPPGPMLEWRRLAELEAAGFEVGAHSHTHPQLDLLAPARVHDEVRRSRDLLEAALGHPVASFAYPHGCATRSVQAAVRDAGFTSACGVRNALSHTRDNPFLIARLTIGASTSTTHLAAWLGGRGAPVARRREHASTTAWRGVRRARHFLAAGGRR